MSGKTVSVKRVDLSIVKGCDLLLSLQALQVHFGTGCANAVWIKLSLSHQKSYHRKYKSVLDPFPIGRRLRGCVPYTTPPTESFLQCRQHACFSCKLFCAARTLLASCYVVSGCCWVGVSCTLPFDCNSEGVDHLSNKAWHITVQHDQSPLWWNGKSCPDAHDRSVMNYAQEVGCELCSVICHRHWESWQWGFPEKKHLPSFAYSMSFLSGRFRYTPEYHLWTSWQVTGCEVRHPAGST